MAEDRKQPISQGGGERGVQRMRPVRPLDPLSEMERMLAEMVPGARRRPGLFEHPAWMDVLGTAEARMPRVDVIERDNEFLLRAEVPGVTKDDLEISVTENQVTIKGETRHEEKAEEGDYYHCEISRGAFSRSVILPAMVDSGKTKAKFENGMLEVRLPKLEAAKRHRVKVD